MITYCDIYDLLSLEYEGDYWDFKQEWTDDKVRLLHDIICMANNLADRDGLIIVGVTDDFKIIGTSTDDKNRRTTQKLNDFLKDIKFVGGNRPMVHVERVFCDNSIKVDAIIVENSKNTPFVLAEDYPSPHTKPNVKVRARQGNIYTRIQDTNTAIDATADNDKVEALWRKRFRIDKTPREKLQYYLADIDGWVKTDKTGEYEYYYQYAPEYTIDLEPYEDEDRRCDFLCKLPIDKTARYCTAHFKVFGSVIWEWFHVNLDGCRYETIMPSGDWITINSAEQQYLYLTHVIEGSLQDLFFKFIRAKDGLPRTHHSYQEDTWLENVIFFSSEFERDRFIKYVESNGKRLWSECENVEDYRYKPDDKGSKDWTLADSQDWKSAQVLAKEYRDWRSRPNRQTL